MIKAVVVFILIAGVFFAIQGDYGGSAVVGEPFRILHRKRELRQTSLILIGDIMLGRTVETKSREVGDFRYPFIKAGGKLREADLVFANLENPIVDGCPRHTGGLVFCANPEMLDGVTFSGVDVVTLANNHTLNYGRDGLEETKRHLDMAGIGWTDGNLVIKEVNGIRFGFLGLYLLDRNLGETDLDLVRTADEQVDILISGIHWGSEYTDNPSQRQREWGQKLLDEGVDIIAGHHPHWVQKWEYLDEKPIFWSLGNFVFDQMWSQRTREGLAVKLVFEGKDLKEVIEMPVYMEDWAQPEFVETSG